jgi:hypothetical protein
MNLSQLQSDIAKIQTGAFTQDITFTTPDGNTTVTVKGFVSKHNMSVDPATGLPVNQRNAHISVNEKTLTDESYPTRVGGEITLKDHKVSFDLLGNTLTFLIDSSMPSETTGAIVCTLGKFVNS